MADQGLKKLLTCEETGRLGGLTTAKKLTPEQRRESAKRAARARWRKKGGDGGNGGGPPNGGLHATIGGAVEYLPNGATEDASKYSVKSDQRKPAHSAPSSASDGVARAA